MHSHRLLIPLDDLKHAFALRQRVDFPQHEGVGDPELARKGAAVTRNFEFGGNEESRLYGRQAAVPLLHSSHEGEKSIELGRLFAHVALRPRNDTMIDFEVGVSLSLPALPSGTSTFSSG